MGLSEEAAAQRYGEHDLEVYHQFFTPLEYTVPQRDENASYGKIVTVKSLQVCGCILVEDILPTVKGS